MDSAGIKTPAALLDLDILERNAERMAERAMRLGVRLRPHVKTHKCVEAARLQVRGHFGGITVSTLAEARAFADGGFRDIIYAVPIAPQRLAEAAELDRRLDRLALLVDHPVTAREIEACAAARSQVLSAYINVDCGGGRAGVDPEGDRVIELARRLHAAENVELCGLLTHAGHAYGCRNRGEVLAVARQERDVTDACAQRVRAEGIGVREASVGSTPTCTAVDHLDGVTEIRPGNYAFFDAFQAAVGSCCLDDVAFCVLTTVIGSYPERGELVVDAGALALSKDAGAVHVDPGCGFGVVLAGDGAVRIPGLRIVSLAQEHGLLRAAGATDVTDFPPGSRLRIIPNHSCLSAALFDAYHVIRDGRVVDVWHPVRGW